MIYACFAKIGKLLILSSKSESSQQTKPSYLIVIIKDAAFVLELPVFFIIDGVDPKIFIFAVRTMYIVTSAATSQ